MDKAVETEAASSSKDQTAKDNEVKFLFTTVLGHKTPLDLISIVFGLIVLIFGILGYVNSQSIISLVSSILIAIPIFIASYFTVQKHLYFSFITLVSSFVLLIAMSIRFFKYYTIYPAGLVSILSLVFCLFLIARLFVFYRMQSTKTSSDQPTSSSKEPSAVQEAVE